jgi:hypothetical protein
MKIQIAMTAWNRYPERFNYFKSAVHALQQKLTAIGHEFSWVVSVESERHLLKEEFDAFCRGNDIDIMYKMGKPNLGSNLNYLQRSLYTDFVFFCQDDFFLETPLDIAKDLDFLLQNPTVGMIRYKAGKHENSKFVGPMFGDLQELSRETHYFYSDGPHLRRKTFHEITGPFIETVAPSGADHSLGEMEMNKRSKIKAPRIFIRHPGEYFGHMGGVSTLNEKWTEHQAACEAKKKK